MIKIKRGYNKSKKAQIFGMPFSVIFSIFLIVVFLVVAFFAIKYFLNIRRCSEIGLFIDDFQNKVKEIWDTPSYTPVDTAFTRSLPSAIEYVCFANLQEQADGTSKEREIYAELRKNADYTANLYFYPQKKACVRATNIEYVDMESLSNPYCIEVVDGKMKIKLEKGRFDALVKVSRA